MNNLKYTEAICVFQNDIKGHVIFRQPYKNKKSSSPKGSYETEIIINLTNVPPGLHGFHIHQSGDLREGCSSLCSHYNPHNKNHGGTGVKERHVGDLGNIKPNKKGVVKKTIYDKLIKLRGKYSVIGRSIVIHEKEDDLGMGENDESLITGNAGNRIACGIIGISKYNC